MTGPLAGRVAIVTGAGRGLGRAHALALAAAGAAVVVNDVGCDVAGAGADASVAAQAVADIRAAGGTAIASTLPVGTADAADALVAAAVASFGGVDVLVNNAGITRSHPFETYPQDDWDRILAVHLTGTFTCARAAFRAMQARGGGRIINTTSGAGLDTPYPAAAAYAAAKAGVAALTRVIAAEGTLHHITCNAIAPLARTRMSETFLADETEPLAPESVSPLVVYLASAASAAVTGHIFRVRQGEIALTQPPASASISVAPTLDAIAAAVERLTRPPAKPRRA